MLGGVERDEQLLEPVARDADAVVAEPDLGELAVAEPRAAPPRGQDLERAAIGHRVQCVLPEVEEHLHQRLGVAGDRWQHLVDPDPELDPPGQLLLEQLLGLAHDLVEVDLACALAAGALAARVVEEPGDDVVEPVGLLDDDVE